MAGKGILSCLVLAHEPRPPQVQLSGHSDPKAEEVHGEGVAVRSADRWSGNLVVGFDEQLRRTTIFPLSGGSPRTLTNSVDGNFSVFGAGRNGPFLLYSPGGSYRPDLEPGAQWIETPVIAMDAGSGRSDTIATLPDRWRVVAPDGNAPMPPPLLYAVQAVAMDGFYWATPDASELRKYDWNGALQQIVRHAATPRPVEPGMVQE